jgi:PucR C-terminal helix-turn-helix domain/GGDEF-like domain
VTPRYSNTLRTLAPTLEMHLPKLVENLTNRLRQSIPHYAELTREALLEQVEEQCASVLRELKGERVDEASGPAAYGRMRAEQGVPLEVVLHAYRVAWAELWAGLLDAAQTPGGPTAEGLLSASSEFFWMADDYAGRMLVSYRRRATELLLRQEQERSATLDGVFSGYLNGAESLWEAAAMLDLPYEGLFVVAAATPAVAGREALPGVRDALSAVGLGSAWHLKPDVEAGIVSLRTPESLPLLIDTLVTRPAIRAGLSPRYSSLAESPQALHLARLTLGALPPDQIGVRQFDDSPLAALLGASPRTARELARTILKGIVELPHTEREILLSTLSTWFDTEGSTAATAAKLFCHPNTVRYRVRRIEKLIARSLENPKDVAEVRAALLAVSMVSILDDES